MDLRAVCVCTEDELYCRLVVASCVGRTSSVQAGVEASCEREHPNVQAGVKNASLSVGCVGMRITNKTSLDVT